MNAISQLNHFFTIMYLMVFKPDELFNRINNLDWYKAMLHQWIADLKIANNSNILEVGVPLGN